MSDIDIKSNNNWKFFDWSGTLICRLATDLSPQNASTNSLRAEGVNACDICSNHVAVYRAVTSFHKIIAHILVSYCVCFEKNAKARKGCLNAILAQVLFVQCWLHQFLGCLQQQSCIVVW